MLRAPIHDDTLGVLDWDERLDWWFGPVQMSPGHEVSFAIAPGAAVTQAAVQNARAVLSTVREHEAAFRYSAASRIVDAYNAFAPTRPIDAAKLADRMRLEEMTIYGDGTADLFFDEDGILAGHAVLVTLDRSGVPNNVTLAA